MSAKPSSDKSKGALRKERGVWVYRTGRRLTAAMTDRVLGRIREARDDAYRQAR
jgi:hypothetical protein